jgi:hypothetical protein
MMKGGRKIVVNGRAFKWTILAPLTLEVRPDQRTTQGTLRAGLHPKDERNHPNSSVTPGDVALVITRALAGGWNPDLSPVFTPEVMELEGYTTTGIPAEKPSAPPRCSCKKNRATLVGHCCPFNVEIHGDNTLCHCCSACRQNCADEI